MATVLRRRNPAVLADEVLGEKDSSKNIPVWIRIMKGPVTQVETPGMAERMPPAWFGGHPRAKRQNRIYLREEQTVDSCRIQGALEITDDRLTLTSFRHRLIGALLIATGACALFGWAAAYRGLRPLFAIAASTQHITAQRLDQRLDAARLPRELGDLVQAINGMLDRLEEAFSRLSRFSADLAHELRNPINNLMGGTEVALSRDRPVGEYREVLESNLEECRRLSNLISRMLFLARTEHLQAGVKRELFQPQRLVDDVLAFFEAIAEDLGVQMEGRTRGSLRGDPELLRQALANLVANALEACPRGGRIQVTIQPVPQGAELRVQDSGRGIPEDELPFVTDRFARTRSSLERKAPGSGLGLAIVDAIARLHGGTLRIESEWGEGTTVSLILPS